MRFDTTAWWTLLCVVGAVNLVVWAGSAASTHRRCRAVLPGHRRIVWLQVALSAGYVLGCAWRCAMPVYDVPRHVMVDSWWSSVIVGRTVATLAELCFAAQWALMLDRAATLTASKYGRAAARMVVPLIALAELFSWHAVLTTANLGHVIEESIWGATALLLVGGGYALWSRIGSDQRPVLGAMIAVGTAYVIYIFCVDVPMYWSRWIADEAQGKQYMTLLQGAKDASERWVVTHRWEDWQSEMVWMTLYFSVAVWLSIGLIHVATRMRSSSSTPLSVRGF